MSHPQHWIQRFLAAALAALLAISTAQAAETVTYIHWDALGSPVAATDEDGNVVWREAYRPYGARINDEAAADSNSRWYTGHPQDADTGLVYAGARYYDPVIGRFLAIDPVGVQADNLHSFNRYAYANNNPYAYVDPDGRAAETVLDLASLGLSVALFVDDPSLANAAGVMVDAAATAVPFVPGGVGLVRSAGKGASVTRGGTEVVQRAMSRAELDFLRENGVLRFGRSDRTFVSDAVNANANRARQRLALPRQPEVRATVEVPAGRFSSPTTVDPLDLGNGRILPGGGLERSTTGVVPARIIRVDEF